MSSYLCNLQQYVDYRGCKSKPYLTKFGVGQGGNFGPLVLIIMINDLHEILKIVHTHYFKMTFKLLFDIKYIGYCERLQEDLKEVVLLCAFTSELSIYYVPHLSKIKLCEIQELS